MLEEAVNDDLRVLIGNIGCMEFHLNKLKRTARRSIARLQKQGDMEAAGDMQHELDVFSRKNRQLRLLRQQYTKLFVGVPRDYNQKDEHQRSSQGEYGCLLKHMLMAEFLAQEIDEKMDYLIANADEDNIEQVKHWRDDILMGGNIAADGADYMRTKIRDNLGLNRKEEEGSQGNRQVASQ